MHQPLHVAPLGAMELANEVKMYRYFERPEPARSGARQVLNRVWRQIPKGSGVGSLSKLRDLTPKLRDLKTPHFYQRDLFSGLLNL